MLIFRDRYRTFFARGLARQAPAASIRITGEHGIDFAIFLYMCDQLFRAVIHTLGTGFTFFDIDFYDEHGTSKSICKFLFKIDNLAKALKPSQGYFF